MRTLDFTRDGVLVWNTDIDVDIQNTIYGMGPRLGGMTPCPPPLDPPLRTHRHTTVVEKISLARAPQREEEGLCQCCETAVQPCNVLTDEMWSKNADQPNK